MNISRPKPEGAGKTGGLPAWQRALVFGGAFYLSAQLARFLSVPGMGYVTFWLPPGIYLAALLLSEPADWAWFIAAAIAANLAFDVPAGTPLRLALCFCCANTASATVGAWLTRRLAKGPPRLANFKEYATLLGSAAIGTSISATIGAATLISYHLASGGIQVWSTWWSADAMAISLVTPLILSLAPGAPAGRRPLTSFKAIAEAALLLCMTGVALSYILLDQHGVMSPNKGVLVVPLLWAGIRFGTRGAASLNLVIGLTLAYFTIRLSTGVGRAELLTGEPLSVLNALLLYGSMVGLVPAIILRERDRTLEQLRESEARFDLATTGTLEGIWERDIVGETSFYAPRFRQLLGYTMEEYPDTRESFLTHLHPDDLEPTIRAVDEHLTRRTPYDVEYRILTAAGEYRWFRSRAQAVWDESGKPLRMAGSIQDITAAKEAGRARRESEEKFSKAFDASPDGICITELVSGRLLEVNEAYCEIYGYRREELLGKSPVDLGIFKTAAERWQFVQTLIDKGSVRDMELETWRREGQPRLVAVSAERIKLGATECIVTVIHDMTERKRSEERFRQSQKMDAIGQLAGGIAHDFNNMLAVIQMQASIMLADPKIEPRVKEELQNIMAAAEKSANLTRKLLTFSRRDTPRVEKLDLVGVISDVIKLLRRVLGENISLETRFASDVPLVKADPGMIEQVIMNLSINARDAMPRGGRLEVTLEGQQVDAGRAAERQAAPGRYVRVAISDTGSGIAPDVLPRIFEPFFTTKSVGEGTGLGLATAFGIVQQHQGWIEVASTVGQGTTFSVFLPALDAAATEASHTATIRKARGGNERVLLVEDEDSVRNLTRHVLEHYGYRVTEAAAPLAALDICANGAGQFDLLVTDIIMPGELNGRELADALHDRQPGLKVLYVSGYSHEVLDHQLRVRQGRGFLQKPFSAYDLASSVRKCLDGEMEIT